MGVSDMPFYHTMHMLGMCCHGDRNHVTMVRGAARAMHELDRAAATTLPRELHVTIARLTRPVQAQEAPQQSA